jgi:hypothetical protein
MPQTLDAKQTGEGKQTGNAALDRLQASIDAAETALRDLRSERPDRAVNEQPLGRDSRPSGRPC